MNLALIGIGVGCLGMIGSGIWMWYLYKTGQHKKKR